MNPPFSWSSETSPTPESRTQGSAAAAKDAQTAAPTSGWEAALSEGIFVGGKIEGEEAALAALTTHHRILYLATDEGDDVAFEAPTSFASTSSAELPTRGFEGFKALEAGGADVMRCPLRMDRGCSLTNDDAEVVDGLLLRLQRPTLIVSTHGWRACAVKALYIGRKAGLSALTEDLIGAAADDQYWPLIFIPDEAGEEQHEQPQSMDEWHKHVTLRRWVEEALAAKTGPGTEAATVGWAGIQGMVGEGI